MHLVPLRTKEELSKNFSLWEPFLDGIARRSKESVDDLMVQIARHDVQIALIWDGEKPCALLGIRLVKRDTDLIGELVWLTGKGRQDWQHLLSQVEEYLRHMGCVACRPICRLGWSKFLKTNGYKPTHITLEKVL